MRHLFALIALVAVTLRCVQCVQRGTYLAKAPPKEQLCGTWVVDRQGTTWELARDHGGYLEIRSDGRFRFEDLPDFSSWGGSVAGRLCHQKGSGTWCISSWGGTRCLELEFDEVGGLPPADDCAHFYFQRAFWEYRLVAVIDDPDSGDYLVLRREREERPAASVD